MLSAFLENHETLNHITQVLLQHGNIALFILLALGIVGLPIPDETLLVTAGVLLAKGKLSLTITPLIALLGSVCGISISYCIGYFPGRYVVKKYGHWMGLTEPRIDRAHYWFERIGIWAVFFGYFIPGVRHLTGYVAGALQTDFKKFALFAYLGAAVWISTFMSIGYFLGHGKF